MMMMIVARLECWSVPSVTPATTSLVTTRPQDALGVSARKTGTTSQSLKTNICNCNKCNWNCDFPDIHNVICDNRDKATCDFIVTLFK